MHSKTANFFSGFLGIFSHLGQILSGLRPAPFEPRRYPVPDRAALQSDWYKIGDDMRRVFPRHRHPPF